MSTRIVPDRRDPILVNAATDPNPRTFADLTPREQDLFLAQLAAWRVAVQLAHEEDMHRMIGGASRWPVGEYATAVRSTSARWDDARAEWRRLRGR